MEVNNCPVIAPMKYKFYGYENKGLYRIFLDTDSNVNTMISKSVDIIDFIGENNLAIEKGADNSYLDLLSKGTAIPLFEVYTIMNFLEGEGYIVKDNSGIRISPEGRLIELMDKAMLSMAMFKFFWEKSDWKELVPYRNKNRFLEKDGRNYLALLLSRHKWSFCTQIPVVLDKSEKCISRNLRTEMLSIDKSMRFILENVLGSMGLLNISAEGEKAHFNTTARGQKLFEYCSRHIFEEHEDMVDESWECYDRGNFEQAYEMALEVLNVIPDKLEAYNILGCVLIRNRRYEEAEKIFTHAIEIFGRLKEVPEYSGFSQYEALDIIQYNLGLCYFHRSEYIRCIKTLRGIRNDAQYYAESISNIIARIKEIIIL